MIIYYLPFFYLLFYDDDNNNNVLLYSVCVGGEHIANPGNGGAGPPGTGTGVHVVFIVTTRPTG